MDDLDHSMHIADYDWTSFYEESEECCLLRASLACADNTSLSDSEDSENPSSVFNTGQKKPRESPACDGAHTDVAGCSLEDQSCSGCKELSAQFNQRSTGERRDDLPRKAEEDSGKRGRGALRADLVIVDEASTELQKGDGNVPKESDAFHLKPKQEPDSSSCNQTDENVREPRVTEGAGCDDGVMSGARAEKERWFVTVNDGPARMCTTSGKKKKRRKKMCKDKHMCSPGDEICEGGRDAEQNSGGPLGTDACLESFQTALISDRRVTLPLTKEENVLQKQVTSHSQTENTSEPTLDANKAGPKNNIPAPKDTPLSGRAESDEFEDGAQFFSSHSYDSENYLSAAESVEEHLFMENQQPDPTVNDNADNVQGRGKHFSDSPLLKHAAAISCRESTSDRAHVEPTQNFPSAHHRVNKTPDDNSTALCVASDTPEHQTPTGLNLPASGCSIGDQLGSSLLPAPELTLTPCSVTDSPETYADATGSARPVYAISAFWDEMEKLTINDILQLRMGRSMPPREIYDTQETQSPSGNAADAPARRSSVVDTVDCSMSDSGVMDTSDTADSDYFTQLDESKPDRSSCEFSTSDFEEEYWQYIGASRNPSPDPRSKSHQSTTDSSVLEEEGSTSSEGKETPVPPEDFEGQCFGDQDLETFSSCDLAWARRITKSQSMHNVHSLDTSDPAEDLFLQSFQSSCQSLDEMTDSLEVVTAAPVLSYRYRDILVERYQISFPEVVEYFFTENKAQHDAVSVAVYDPEDISVAPAYALCTFDHELPFTSLSSEQKPIPIFSCSHPTVRELTFPRPDHVFLSSNCSEEDDISPIRVASRSLIRAFDRDRSAAGRVGPPDWKSFLSIRKVRFHDKGSIWCRNSGAWAFPAEDEKTSVKGADAPVTVRIEGRVSSAPSRLFTELVAQQSILEAMQTSTKRQGIFSTIKQSDMCLVCIAFASWVLRSSDPEAADTWKAALLANVSALSAIQYLRQYVKKKMNPPQDDP